MSLQYLLSRPKYCPRTREGPCLPRLRQEELCCHGSDLEVRKSVVRLLSRGLTKLFPGVLMVLVCHDGVESASGDGSRLP